jgi:hypothetical protein
MQKSRVRTAALRPLLVTALLGAIFQTGDLAKSDPRPPAPAEAGAPATTCNPDNVIVYQADQAPETNPDCVPAAESLTQDRDYLVETATPGATMVRQGAELAIGRLHPEFVRRLASAIREARQAGLSSAGIFSAYRPPAFGVGGFSDKFNSLHTYGLAADMSGIGGAGSAEARLWYEIAARNGVTCPYGLENPVEWNHCQPTRIKIILPQNPLRETVTANGPVDLGSMFEAGNAMIETPESVAEAASAQAADATARALGQGLGQGSGQGPSHGQPAAEENGSGLARRRLADASLPKSARAESLSESQSCKHPQHSSRDACDTSRHAASSAHAHPRQASTSASRHHT